MSKIVEKQPTNALVVYTKVNFDDLNGNIEALGSFSGKLSTEEKTLGIKLLEEWKNNVQDRLREKLNELEQIESFLGHRSSGYGRNYEMSDFQELRENMAKLSKTESLYGKYLKAKDELDSYEITAPDKPTYNPTISELDNDRIYGGYEKEHIEWTIEQKKLEYIKTKAYGTWLRAVRNSSGVKDFMTRLSSQKTLLKQYQSEAAIKANKCKINISISNPGIRKSINEILEFARTI